MVDQTDPAIVEVQQKNKAKEFEMKKAQISLDVPSSLLGLPSPK